MGSSWLLLTFQRLILELKVVAWVYLGLLHELPLRSKVNRAVRSVQLGRIALEFSSLLLIL